MSEFERASALLASVPPYKLEIVIAYLQGIVDGVTDIPNAVTVAALQEGDEMLRTGTGQHFQGKAADFFAVLDAEDDADADLFE